MLRATHRTTSASVGLWRRQTTVGPNEQPLGARWVSVVRELEWGPAAGRSTRLSALRAATDEATLSIGIHGFGCLYPSTDGNYRTGTVMVHVGHGSESGIRLRQCYCSTSQSCTPGYSNTVSIGIELWDVTRRSVTKLISAPGRDTLAWSRRRVRRPDAYFVARRRIAHALYGVRRTLQAVQQSSREETCQRFPVAQKLMEHSCDHLSR